MAKTTAGKAGGSRRDSFAEKLGASLERNPTHAPTSAPAAVLPGAEAPPAAAPPAARKVKPVFMEFLAGDEAHVRRITKFLVNHERMGVNRMRVVRLALQALAEQPETLRLFDAVLQEDGRTRANRQKRSI